MTKKTSSRATKMVLASLLAASIAIPTAASANPISTSDRAASALKETIATDKVIELNVYKSGTMTPEPSISSHLVPQGTLVEKNGKTYAKVTIAAKSAAMIAGFQTKQGEEYVDAESVTNADETITYTVPVVADKVYPSKIHVVVPAFNMDKWYEFDMSATVAKADVDTDTGAETINKMGVKVYKDGTKEDSIMNDYMSPVASVKKLAEGNEVTVTFPKGHYIHGFKINGKEVPIASDNKETKARTYTFKVADLTKSVNADLHVIVNEGPIKYDENHKVQLAFSDQVTSVKNPFKDIDKDGNKDAIVALYGMGIVKGADQFNPRNNITRSQFALMVARALNLETTKDAGFKDLGKITDKERLSAINSLAEAGIVQSNAKFNPNDTLTRQQGALMLYRAIQFAEGKEIKKGDTTLPFYADGKVITDPEAKHAFALLYAEKIMTGAPQANGKVLIGSGDSLQRTQMAKILFGSLEFMNK